MDQHNPLSPPFSLSAHGLSLATRSPPPLLSSLAVPPRSPSDGRYTARMRPLARRVGVVVGCCYCAAASLAPYLTSEKMLASLVCCPRVVSSSPEPLASRVSTVAGYCADTLRHASHRRRSSSAPRAARESCRRRHRQHRLELLNRRASRVAAPCAGEEARAVVQPSCRCLRRSPSRRREKDIQH